MWLQHVNVTYERKYLLGHMRYNTKFNLKMCIFRKTNVSKNGHNFACDQYIFFMKLAPLDSAHIGLYQSMPKTQFV